MAIISFAKTVEEFKTGIKTCTRRDWKEKYFLQWGDWYNRGRTVHRAYDKSPRNGGKSIGLFRLTCKPYVQYLYDMPESDLLAEGGMCKTLEEFYELIGMKPTDTVTVVRFIKI